MLIPSNVLVSGLVGTAALLNGTYKYVGTTLNNLPTYSTIIEYGYSAGNMIYNDGVGNWIMEETLVTGGDYYINSNPSDNGRLYPWLVNGWYSDQLDPAELVNISLSEVPYKFDYYGTRILTNVIASGVSAIN